MYNIMNISFHSLLSQVYFIYRRISCSSRNRWDWNKKRRSCQTSTTYCRTKWYSSSYRRSPSSMPARSLRRLPFRRDNTWCIRVDNYTSLWILFKSPSTWISQNFQRAGMCSKTSIGSTFLLCFNSPDLKKKIEAIFTIFLKQNFKVKIIKVTCLLLSFICG